jgi:hypothetical protein
MKSTPSLVFAGTMYPTLFGKSTTTALDFHQRYSFVEFTQMDLRSRNHGKSYLQKFKMGSTKFQNIIWCFSHYNSTRGKNVIIELGESDPRMLIRLIIATQKIQFNVTLM